MKDLLATLMTWIMVLLLSSPVLAEYTLVLKNGRRITVQSYREDGNMLRIQGLGGELGIPKEQVQTIIKAGDTNQGLSLRRLESEPRPAASSPAGPTPVASEAGSEAINNLAPSSNEEKVYQARLHALTQQLAAARERYISASQGGDAAAAATEEGYKAMVADVMSRLKDRQGPRDSVFEQKAIELQKLRLEIDRLQKERDALMDEMKQKISP